MPADMVRTPTQIISSELENEKVLCARHSKFARRKIVRTPIMVPLTHYYPCSLQQAGHAIRWNGSFTTYHCEPNPFFDPVRDTHW